MPEHHDALYCLQGRVLGRGVIHACLGRWGGTSKNNYASLNLGLGLGDDPACVRANLERVRKFFGFASLVSARQVHGTRMLRVRGDEGEVADCDALCTDRPEVGLLIRQADCQAVLLYDPPHRAVAALHVGWRGNAADLPGLAVARMALEFGSRPADLRALISPALGPCCGEFRGWQELLPAALHGYRLPGDHFDFQAITRDQLSAAGLASSHMEILPVCTVCSQDFFSHRRACRQNPDNPRTGRQGSVIGLPGRARQ